MAHQKTRLQAQTRILPLALVCLCLGLAIGALWYYRGTTRTLPGGGQTDVTLSESTKNILHTLPTSVDIHYYSLLDLATVSDSLRGFAERVSQLLSKYVHEASGKITVTRHTRLSEAAVASADGIKAFNVAPGEPCFLGITIACNNQKEIVAQLAPEWEAALESDLTRAIARITAASPASRTISAQAYQPDAAIIAEVTRLVPDLASVSLEEGKQILHDAALKEIKQAMDETQHKVEEARKRISQAKNNNPEAEHQALKELQQVQALQTEKLKELATRAQERIQALEQIKSR